MAAKHLAVCLTLLGMFMLASCSCEDEKKTGTMAMPMTTQAAAPKVAAMGNMAMAAKPTAACKSLAEVASSVPELSTLVAAVKAAGGDLLKAVTDSKTAVTVFAPTNAAFASTLKKLNLEASALFKDTKSLNKILAYHVVPVPVASKDIKNGQKAPTLMGKTDTLTLSTAGGKVTVEGVGSKAMVVKADVPACKSVVHVVDNVLLPMKA